MGILGGVYSFLGYMNQRKGKNDKAEKLYEKALDKGATNYQYQMAYGVLLLKKGEFEKAKSVFERILIFHPNNKQIRSSAKINQSIVYWKLGELDTALEILTEVHNRLKNTRTYSLLGYLLIEEGDLEKALELNLKALEYDDRDAEILDNLAQTYYRMGDKEKALKYFKRAEEENSDQTSTIYHLACIYQENGNLDKARTMFEKALSRDISAISAISRKDIEERLNTLPLGNVL